MELRYFSPSEFSEDISHASPALLKRLDTLRSWYGDKIFPSPVQGALARFDVSEQDSQHYAGDGQVSRAVDWFPNGSVQKAWLLAVSSNLFGGIGIYFDTKYEGKRWPMLHTDIRDRKPTLLWYRLDGRYYYFQYNEESMHNFFATMEKM